VCANLCELRAHGATRAKRVGIGGKPGWQSQKLDKRLCLQRERLRKMRGNLSIILSTEYLEYFRKL
jgi:hypothetical protein